MDTTLSELRKKEVINLTDGRRLGRIIDVVIDTCRGRIIGILVPGKCNGFLARNEEIYIDYNSICNIGEDVIVVELNKFCEEEIGRGRRGKRDCGDKFDRRIANNIDRRIDREIEREEFGGCDNCDRRDNCNGREHCERGDCNGKHCRRDEKNIDNNRNDNDIKPNFKKDFYNKNKFDRRDNN